MKSIHRFHWVPVLACAVMLAAATSVYASSTATITALAIDPQTPTTVYAGTSGGGVFKSTDGGDSWSSVGPANINVLSLAVAPATPTTVYAGEEGGSVYKSTDAGATWARIFVNDLSPAVCSYCGAVRALGIDRLTPSTLFSATDWLAVYGADGHVSVVFGDVYKSSDGGAHFAPSLNNSRPVPFSSLAIAGGENGGPPTIYAGHAISPYWVNTDEAITTGGIVRSTDGGATWNVTSLAGVGSVTAVAADPLTPATVYAAEAGVKLFKSIDGGETWHVVMTGVSIETLALAPSNPSIVYAGGAGIYKSTDAGATWRGLQAGIGFVSTVAVDPLNPDIVYAGTSTGVYKTTDGGISWRATGLVDLSAAPFLDVHARITGGTWAVGSVWLPILVPDDGAAYIFLWSSNGSVASVPSEVIVWGGFYYTGFQIFTSPVSERTPVEIFASFDGTTTSVVTVVEPAAISELRVSPTSVAAGGQSTGIVTLSGPAPSSGAVVALASSAPAAAVPVSVTVAPDATTATFTISTNPVAATTAVTISATYGAVTRNAVLTVDPLTLSSVFLAPATVTGGGLSSGTVTLSGPAPTAGAVVALTSSNVAVATVPTNVVVPAGSTSATFTVSTSASCGPATATITASYAGVSASTVLTVVPRPADTVTIQRADYFRNRKVLRVSATSSVPTAALQAFVTSSGALIGGLTTQGGGSYSGEFNLQPDPQSITIRSSACGSATKFVDVK